jgi:hypothetical protein
MIPLRSELTASQLLREETPVALSKWAFISRKLIDFLAKETSSLYRQNVQVLAKYKFT